MKGAGTRDQEIKQALLDIAAAHDGVITAEMVLEVARDPDSVLHEALPKGAWNDGIAAERYRVDCCRELIRRFNVPSRDCTKDIPLFVRYTTLPTTEAGYVYIERVRNDPSMAAGTLIDELARLLAISERCGRIAGGLEALPPEFGQRLAAIHAALNTLAGDVMAWRTSAGSPQAA